MSVWDSLVGQERVAEILQQAAAEITSASFDEEREIDEILDETEKRIFGVSRKYLKNAFLPF